MAERRFPVLVATRVTRCERAMIVAAAASSGLNVSTLIRRILLPAVGEHLAAEAAVLTRTAQPPGGAREGAAP